MVFDLPFKYITIDDTNHMHLRNEIQKWLEQKCPNEWHWRVINKDNVEKIAAYIIIHDDKIALQFKMTWL